MLKFVSLLKRKAGLTHQEFVDYYENQHAPLSLSFWGEHIQGYCRNFVDAEKVSHSNPNSVAPDFDVITEFWFLTRESYETARKIMQQPDVAEVIRNDERAFLDKSVVRSYLVEERISDISAQGLKKP